VTDDDFKKRSISQEYRGDGRLKAQLISKALLNRPIHQIRTDAIRQLCASNKNGLEFEIERNLKRKT
jgi:hypothetical protein